MSDDIRTCKATNKQGRPCRAAAGDRDYCYFHANPGVAAQVGRMGGRQNRRVVEGHATPLPPLTSISGVQSAMAQMIADVLAYRLKPRTAACLAPLFRVLVSTFGPHHFEERVNKFEETINARD